MMDAVVCLVVLAVGVVLGLRAHVLLLAVATAAVVVLAPQAMARFGFLHGLFVTVGYAVVLQVGYVAGAYLGGRRGAFGERGKPKRRGAVP